MPSSAAASPPTAPATELGIPPLGVRVAGLAFRNPIVLASGTAGFGVELDEVVDLSAVGGIATKAVSVVPRTGNPALRVSEFAGGMINAIGLANPGLEAVKRDYLPWMPAHHPGTRLVVNVVGNSIEDFATVVAALDGERGVDAFELNVSCPNVKAGGLEFGADPRALAALVTGARAVTARPIFVKLSPTLGAGIVDTARVAIDSGATGLTVVNTMPGLVIDTRRRRPKISFGSGGISGPALLPMGLLATWRVSQALPGVPLIGLGGVSSGDDAVQYLLAGASLVGVGTAAMRDPRAPERIVRQLRAWTEREGVRDLTTLIGTLQWPT
ncbi:MAG: dihydroorotate dehydrogenase [Gemmatimonas sp.]|uniref:dihydroorotate dehydrogenase n=1 Tax=Gemmatimonas sp. TaxID=1962908 RepID=UPI00391F1BA3|nr:dihydroorotate dehydrogenase [Gemmatimonadota bacterium]